MLIIGQVQGKITMSLTYCNDYLIHVSNLHVHVFGNELRSRLTKIFDKRQTMSA